MEQVGKVVPMWCGCYWWCGIADGPRKLHATVPTPAMAKRASSLVCFLVVLLPGSTFQISAADGPRLATCPLLRYYGSWQIEYWVFSTSVKEERYCLPTRLIRWGLSSHGKRVYRMWVKTCQMIFVPGEAGRKGHCGRRANIWKGLTWGWETAQWICRTMILQFDWSMG